MNEKTKQLKIDSISKAAAGVVGIARVLGEVDKKDRPVISSRSTQGNLLYGLEALGALIRNEAEDLESAG